MIINYFKKNILIAFGLIFSFMLSGQPHVESTLNIGEIERKPCLSYLNFLGLDYRPQMLRKDTLIFDYKDEMIIFIQKNKKLISARFINKLTNLDFSKCLLKNGTGKLIIFKKFILKTDTSSYWLLNFQDGILTDTSYHIQFGKLKETFVFDNNDLRAVDRHAYNNFNTIHSHHEYLYGLEHGKHLWYGLLHETNFIIHYKWDKYDGKLFMEKVFNNGQLLEETEYKKHGEVSWHQKFPLRIVYPFVEKKECE